MYDYVLIVHPTNEELLYKYEPGMKNKSRVLVKKVLEWMSPFKAAEVEGLNSHLGRTAKGALVMCPLLMEQMVSLSPRKIMKAVISTIEFSKTLNPKLIGLTAYAAFSGNKGLDLAALVDVPLTNGMHYTLTMLPEAILRAAKVMGIDIGNTNILLLGGTSSVGKYCLDHVSCFGRSTYFTSHNKDKLNLVMAQIPQEKQDKLQHVEEIHGFLDKVKIVIVATNRVPVDFDIKRLLPGSVVFDASYPRQIAVNARDDILVIDGVTIRPPGNVNFNFDFGLPSGLCYPCMAEPMILALEKQYGTYSLGKESDEHKIKEIKRWSAKHGFEIAYLTGNEKIITDEQIARINHNAQQKRKRKALLWV